MSNFTLFHKNSMRNLFRFCLSLNYKSIWCILNFIHSFIHSLSVLWHFSHILSRSGPHSFSSTLNATFLFLFWFICFVFSSFIFNFFFNCLFGFYSIFKCLERTFHCIFLIDHHHHHRVCLCRCWGHGYPQLQLWNIWTIPLSNTLIPLLCMCRFQRIDNLHKTKINYNNIKPWQAPYRLPVTTSHWRLYCCCCRRRRSFILVCDMHWNSNHFFYLFCSFFSQPNYYFQKSIPEAGERSKCIFHTFLRA